MKTFNIRRVEAKDRPRIEEIVNSSSNFNQEEVRTALELVDEALEKGEETGYIIKVIELTGSTSSVVGYACYGPTPLTQGVYDLYWIVIDQSLQGKGFGRLLIANVEQDVLLRGGRMLLIETSSQDSYAGTILFYQKRGYQEIARVRDFYRIGDDKLIFSKNLVKTA